MKDLWILGCGGHALSLTNLVEESGEWKLLGYIDNKEAEGNVIGGYPVVGNDDGLLKLKNRCNNILIGLGMTKSNIFREKIYNKLKNLGFNFPIIISPKASVSRSANIGTGTVVLPFAVVGAGVIIGINSIINTGAIVEHSSQIGNHVHLSTGSIVNGDCQIEDRVMFGSGAILIQGRIISEDITIGAGAVVTKNLKEVGVYVGTPAEKRN